MNNKDIGMELDGERSQYHFNARSYDPQLSRFFAPDLLFDMFPNQSPYSYSNNSPLNFKDPSGMAPLGYKTFDQREEEGFENMSRAIEESRDRDEKETRTGGGVGGGTSAYGGGSFINDIVRITSYGGLYMTRALSDFVFDKMFLPIGFEGYETKLNFIRNSFLQILESAHGLDMISNIAEKLGGDKIILLGVTRKQMDNLDDGKYKNTLGLTSHTRTKNSFMGNLTIRIALDFETSGENVGLYEELGTRGLYYNQRPHSLSFSLVYSFAHELGHVFDLLNYSNYNTWSRELKENSANNHAYDILGSSYFDEYNSFTGYFKRKK